MVKFKTVISFARYHTDSRLMISFDSLCSIEFLTYDVAGNLPGWDMEELCFYAEYDKMSYVWDGSGAPKEFTGPWKYLDRVEV